MCLFFFLISTQSYQGIKPVELRLQEVTLPYVRKKRLEERTRTHEKTIETLLKKDAIQKVKEELAGLPPSPDYLVYPLVTRGNRREIFRTVLDWLLLQTQPTVLAFENRDGKRTLYLAYVPE
ncbi:hypothetical protein LAZ67_12003458, partial [Cordylochernes scorpioides]